MKLSSLTIKGITSFEDFYMDLSDIQGTVAITGQNGAGKTTVLECICFCLTGDMPSRDGIKIYDLLNTDDAVIELEYSLMGDSYKHRVLIDRQARKQEGYLWINDLPQVDGKISTYKSFCESNIIKPHVWYSSYFNSQNNKGNFLELSTSDRKKMMIDMLGLQKLTQISDKAKEDLNKLSIELSTLQTILDDKKSKTIDTNDLNSELKAKEHELDTKQVEYKEISDSRELLVKKLPELKDKMYALRSISTEIDNLSKNIDSSELELSTYEKSKDATQVSISDKSNEIIKLETNIVENKELLALNSNKLSEYEAKYISDIAEYDTKIQEAKDDYDILDMEYNNAVEELKAEKDTVDAKVSELNTLITGKEKEIVKYEDSYKRELNTLNYTANNKCTKLKSDKKNLEKWSSIASDIPCKDNDNLSNCRFRSEALDGVGKIQAIDSELDTIASNLNEDIKKLEVTHNNLMTKFNLQLSNLNIEANESKDKQLELSTKIQFIDSEFKTDLKKFTDNLNTSNSHKSNYILESEKNKSRLTMTINMLSNNILDGQKQISIYKKSIGEEELRLEDITKSISTYKSDLMALEYDFIDLLKDNPDAGKQITELESEYGAIENKIKANSLELEAINYNKSLTDKAINVIKSRLEMAQNMIEEIQALDAQITEVNKKIYVSTYLSNTFGANGIQALEIDNAGPEISELVNSLLRDCFGDRFLVEFITSKAKVTGKGQKEVFTINVSDLNSGHSGDIKEFSGGEKTIVSIAVQLAIALFNCNRSNLKFKTLFFDEITSALSEDNSGLCSQMLEKARVIGDFDSVLFITHSPSAMDQACGILEVQKNTMERIK